MMQQKDKEMKERFTNYGGKIKNIKNTRGCNARDLDVVTVTNNSIECSNNYSKHMEVYSNISEVSHVRQIVIL